MRPKVIPACGCNLIRYLARENISTRTVDKFVGNFAPSRIFRLIRAISPNCLIFRQFSKRLFLHGIFISTGQIIEFIKKIVTAK